MAYRIKSEKCKTQWKNIREYDKRRNEECEQQLKELEIESYVIKILQKSKIQQVRSIKNQQIQTRKI